MTDKKDIKRMLLEECRKRIDQKINIAKQEIEGLQEASSNETKSSAGDKYETGREMMRLEEDKYASQIAEALKSQRVLTQINIEKDFLTADLGSLIQTNNGFYFLSLPVGPVDLSGQDYYLISPPSPIGMQLKNKKAGENFTFNGKRYEILGVW